MLWVIGATVLGTLIGGVLGWALPMTAKVIAVVGFGLIAALLLRHTISVKKDEFDHV